MTAFVQSKAASSFANTNTLAITLDAAPTPNSELYFLGGMQSTSQTISSITQTGVTWERITGAISTVRRMCEVWRGIVGPGAAAAATVNYPSNGISRSAVIAEFLGTRVNQSDAKVALNNANAANPTTGSVTARERRAVYLAIVCGNTVPSAPTNGFTTLNADTTQSACKPGVSYLEVDEAPTSRSTAWTATSTAYDAVIVAVPFWVPRHPACIMQDPGFA